MLNLPRFETILMLLNLAAVYSVPPQQQISAFCKVGQLFFSTTIQYLFSNSLQSIEIFQEFHSHNTRSPWIIEQISNWSIKSSRYATKNLDSHGLSNRTIFLKMKFAYTNQILEVLELMRYEKPTIDFILTKFIYSIGAAANEDPHYGIFLTSSLQHVTGEFHNFARLSITTRWIFICLQNPDQVFIGCMTCQDSFVDVSWARTTGEIDSEWNFWNKVLNRGVVFMNPAPISKTFTTTCGQTHKMFSSTRSSCLVGLLENIHNSSAINKNPKELEKYDYGFSINNCYLTDMTLKSWILSRRWKKEIALTFRIYNYNYIIVVKRGHKESFRALFEPLDCFTWTGIGATCFLLLLISWLEERDNKKILEFGWSLYSVLLCQGNQDITKVSKYRSRYFWAGSFIVSALALGIFYQGELSSSLTAVEFPTIPQTLAELAESGLQILTIPNWIGNGKPVSIFLDLLESYSVSQPRQRSITLRKICNNTKIVGGYSLELAKNISDGTDIMDGANKKIQFNQRSIFAVMDDQFYNLRFGEGIALYDKFIVKQNSLHEIPIEMRECFCIRRNFLEPFISRSKARIDEAGLDQAWDILEIQRNNRYQLFQIHKSKYPASVRKQLSAWKPDKRFSNFEYVTITSMKYFFFAFLTLNALSILAYHIEIYMHVYVFLG